MISLRRTMRRKRFWWALIAPPDSYRVAVVWLECVIAGELEDEG